MERENINVDINVYVFIIMNVYIPLPPGSRGWRPQSSFQPMGGMSSNWSQCGSDPAWKEEGKDREIEREGDGGMEGWRDGDTVPSPAPPFPTYRGEGRDREGDRGGEGRQEESQKGWRKEKRRDGGSAGLAG